MTNYPPPPPQQPGYGNGQYGSPYGVPQQSGTNGLAIAGFVLAFFCSILGLIFSIIGLNQAKQRGQGGQGLAIAGIIISIVSMVIGAIIVANR